MSAAGSDGRSHTVRKLHALVANRVQICRESTGCGGLPKQMGSTMSLYFFRISHGRYSGASDQPSEFESREAAWAEMTKVCASLVGSISRSLKQNAEWHMELLD
jgi:hypothetical protein